MTHNFTRDELACVIRRRAAFIGASALALSVSAYFGASQAADPIDWTIAARSMSLCSTMSEDELKAALQTGECVAYLEQLGELMPAVGPEFGGDPLASGPLVDRDGGSSSGGSGSGGSSSGGSSSGGSSSGGSSSIGGGTGDGNGDGGTGNNGGQQGQGDQNGNAGNGNSGNGNGQGNGGIGQN